MIKPTLEFCKPLGKLGLQHHLLDHSGHKLLGLHHLDHSDTSKPLGKLGLHHLDHSDTSEPLDKSASLHSMDMRHAPLYSSLHSMDSCVLFNSKVHITKLLDNNLASGIHSTEINPAQSYSSLHSMDSPADDLGIHNKEFPVEYSKKKKKTFHLTTP